MQNMKNKHVLTTSGPTMRLNRSFKRSNDREEKNKNHDQKGGRHNIDKDDFAATRTTRPPDKIHEQNEYGVDERIEETEELSNEMNIMINEEWQVDVSRVEDEVVKETPVEH